MRPRSLYGTSGKVRQLIRFLDVTELLLIVPDASRGLTIAELGCTCPRQGRSFHM